MVHFINTKKKELSGTEYKKLIGHSGPVYGLSFSHDNKYLISCSEDKTGKAEIKKIKNKRKLKNKFSKTMVP